MEGPLRAAIDWQKSGIPVAIATVVATGGSAPRPNGATLYATNDGRFEGSVSGGCVENDVIAHAGEVLGARSPRLVTYGISDEDAFSVGLACGGTIVVFIERALLLDETASLLARQRPGALVTVVAGPDRGAKALIDLASGDLTGPFPENLAADVLADARSLVASEQSRLLTYGERRVFIQALAPSPRLVIFGAVHIAQALSRIAQDLGYHVTVSDHRPAFTTPDRFPAADEVIAAPTADAVARIAFDAGTFVAVLSHDARTEDPVLLTALAAPTRYVGVLGSRRTHAKRIERLRAAGLADDLIDRMHAPIGLSVGARSPEEIAVSIAAEMTSARYRHDSEVVLRGVTEPFSA